MCEIGRSGTGRLAVWLVASLLLAGCSIGPRTNGPFGRSASRVGSQCFWTTRNGVGTFWNHRQRATGAVIPHIRGKDVMNLVLVLKPSGRQGTASSESIYYHSGSSHYLLNPGVGIQLFNGDEHGC